MALPVLSKTWRFSYDHTIAAAAEETWNDNFYLGWKDALLNADSNFDTVPTGIPTVDHSCDSAVAGTPADAVDRWIDIGDIVHNTPGNAHSWFVWKLALNGGACEMLLDIDGAGGTQADLASLYFSWSAGFTGGTTTNRPTATDEWEATETIDFTVITGAGPDTRWHLWMSADGQEMRTVLFTNPSVASTYYGWGQIDNPRVNADTPMWAIAKGSGSEGAQHLTYTEFNTIQGARGYDDTLGLVFGMFCTGQKSNAGSLVVDAMTTVEEIDSDTILERMGLFATTSLVRGPKGAIKDLYWGQDIRVIGSTYPLDGTRQFIQLGKLIFPHDGSILSLEF